MLIEASSLGVGGSEDFSLLPLGLRKLVNVMACSGSDIRLVTVDVLLE